MLGLLATPSQFPAIALPAIGLALFLTLVARPVAVWLCLLPFRYRPDETAFISWVGLRGAVSILLAILPLMRGHGIVGAGLDFERRTDAFTDGDPADAEQGKRLPQHPSS